MHPTRSNRTSQHVIEEYIQPARKRGDRLVKVHVGTVQKELGWTNRTPSIFSTLSSGKFQREAGVELIEKQNGPASGGPSTTVQFVYQLIADDPNSKSKESTIPNGSGLLELKGILTGIYQQLGGSETYIERERESLQFPAEGTPNIPRKAKR